MSKKTIKKTIKKMQHTAYKSVVTHDFVSADYAKQFPDETYATTVIKEIESKVSDEINGEINFSQNED